MSYNFPDAPNPGDTFAPPGGPAWRWNGTAWTIPVSLTGGGTEWDDILNKPATFPPTVPIAWDDISGEPATFPPTVPIAWTDVSGKPATFPPTLPIASSGVTGLDAAQTAQDTAIGTKLNSSAYTAADVLTKLLTVDGSGSNLDADLLDGQSSAFYATASSVTGKEPTIAAGTAAQYWQGTKTWQTLDKTAVGLGSVDNTADSAKPVSTAQAAADALNVLKAGDTMTGNLIVSKANASLVVAKAASGEEATIVLRTGATNRFEFITDTAAESAGNGSHFRLYRCNDAGTRIDTPIVINRSTGQLSLFPAAVSGTLSSTASVIAKSGTAVPAGGTSAFLCSSTTTLGIYFGSGAPTVTAAQGSIYIRTDGSSSSTRLYVNTTGAAVWVNFTSAS